MKRKVEPPEGEGGRGRRTPPSGNGTGPGRRTRTSSGPCGTTPTTWRPACCPASSSPRSFPKVVLENFSQEEPQLHRVGGRGDALRLRDPGRPAGSDAGGYPGEPAAHSRASRWARPRSQGEGRRSYPAGSYVIKRNQPYGRLAKILLEKQDFPDPSLRTYDDTGWTMGLMLQTDVKAIADKAILDVAHGRGAPSRASPVGSRAQAAAGYAVAHLGSNEHGHASATG